MLCVLSSSSTRDRRYPGVCLVFRRVNLPTCDISSTPHNHSCASYDQSPSLSVLSTKPDTAPFQSKLDNRNVSGLEGCHIHSFRRRHSLINPSSSPRRVHLTSGTRRRGECRVLEHGQRRGQEKSEGDRGDGARERAGKLEGVRGYEGTGPRRSVGVYEGEIARHCSRAHEGVVFPYTPTPTFSPEHPHPPPTPSPALATARLRF